MVKLKSVLRAKVYRYNMDKDIENLVNTCPSYQKLSKPQKLTPVQMTNLPKAPWSKIAADFYGALPTGETLLLVTDLFSKSPIVEIMKSTSYNIVSTRLDNLFSLFGYPGEITTDNTVLVVPRRNGQVVRFMPNLVTLFYGREINTG